MKKLLIVGALCAALGVIQPADRSSSPGPAPTGSTICLAVGDPCNGILVRGEASVDRLFAAIAMR